MNDFKNLKTWINKTELYKPLILIPEIKNDILRLIKQSEKINELYKGGIFLEPKGVKTDD